MQQQQDTATSEPRRLMSLPLHPRRAQQLFQDVLLSGAQATPQVSSQTLPQRLQQLQRLNLSGIREAKRGTTFQLVRAATDSTMQQQTENVLLKLSKDGSTLQVVFGNDHTPAFSIRMLCIRGITSHAMPMHSFSLQIGDRKDGSDNNAEADNKIASVLAGAFVAPSADTLNRWIVALTCGVDAFQKEQQQQTHSHNSKAIGLVWQAVRLRIFELAEVISLSSAVIQVIQSISQQDLHQHETLRHRLRFLHCD